MSELLINYIKIYSERKDKNLFIELRTKIDDLGYTPT